MTLEITRGGEEIGADHLIGSINEIVGRNQAIDLARPINKAINKEISKAIDLEPAIIQYRASTRITLYTRAEERTSIKELIRIPKLTTTNETTDGVGKVKETIGHVMTDHVTTNEVGVTIEEMTGVMTGEDATTEVAGMTGVVDSLIGAGIITRGTTEEGPVTGLEDHVTSRVKTHARIGARRDPSQERPLSGTTTCPISALSPNSGPIWRTSPGLTQKTPGPIVKTNLDSTVTTNRDLTQTNHGLILKTNPDLILRINLALNHDLIRTAMLSQSSLKTWTLIGSLHMECPVRLGWEGCFSIDLLYTLPRNRSPLPFVLQDSGNRAPLRPFPGQDFLQGSRHSPGMLVASHVSLREASCATSGLRATRVPITPASHS